MSFRAFEQAIVSPALHQVAAHWNDARGERLMPSWRALNPAAIAAHLPIVWSYKYDREKDEFTSRIAGEKIVAIIGKNVRGVPMAEIFSKEEFPIFFARCKRVVSEPALCRGHGLVFKQLDRYGLGERIILPLSSDGVRSDGLLGATEYRPFAGTPSPGVGSVKDVEEWYSCE